ncbi:type I DNA topoisomerase [uncultured Jatrophihabitans sp.]|uniref:type I DNA topoisomerase n=1 Tax=uncultured Jatrophihabitans sp. TaxID=1610747 RepID=UPI0035C9C0B7
MASKGGTGTKLVIVESPAKAKTIGGYLGADYVVEASIGHIRELPPNAASVPAQYKGLPWASLGVDVDNDFEALYVISADRKQQVSKLRALVKDADELYLATDEDREGEAIAWHLVETLKPKVPVRRMVFHEITPSAIAGAVANPREIDSQLVDAQRTRQILDRLVGYGVSPVLWKKVLPGLSAGRVQSVATRMVVEKERERMAFHAASYWDVVGTFAPAEPKPNDPSEFTATLVSVDDTRLATGRDFDPATGRAPSNVLHLDEAGARGLAARLDGRPFTVQGVDEKPYRRRPYAPFMTSTLQQEAGRKFRWSAQQVMRTAQRLYENGFITYMRTDSTNLSTTALDAARTQARELYGDAYVPAEPRVYTRKSKNAQEAHEAIRPAGDAFRTPGQVASALSSDEFRLYELIWQRTLASQMADAVGTTVSIRMGATSASDEAVVFTTSGRTITFPGFLRAYVEDTDSDADKDDAEKRLPLLTRGDALLSRAFDPTGHTTSPPSRYTEPSLVKAMEELGIGRPSTYASIMQTIQDRGYVWKKGPALIPTWTAFAVIGLLEGYFARLVDYGFTASVENDLDSIATGERSRVGWLQGFYFGDDSHTGDSERISAQGGLKKLIAARLEEIDARGINSIPLGFSSDPAQDVVVRVGRYGPYLQQGTPEDGRRASLPDDLAPDELTPEKVEELLSAPSGDRELGALPDGREVTAKSGRYGPYVTDGERTASLFKTMSLDTVTLDEAVQLLTLPRVLGQLDGEDVTAQNGRYGPYIKRGTDSRSIETEEQLFTITIDEAAAILAQPKQRGRRAAAAPPLRTLGNDPVSEKPMVIKDGRFGPYVTDGETNASLRKGDEIESITDDRASELLADRRLRGPAKKSARKASKKTASKKTAAKKSASAKTAAGKTAAKKTATKKTAAKKAPAKSTS